MQAEWQSYGNTKTLSNMLGEVYYKENFMKVIVTGSNPMWPNMFENEASRIREIFGEELISVHHIGSTSVSGLKAKPIIDIMPVVREIKVVDNYNDKMIAFGYEPMGEFGIPGRRYFRKGGDNRTHQIHVFQFDSKDVERHLAFRDFLRQHPDEANRYAKLKELLAGRFPNDIVAYSEGKNDFVKELEEKAIKWLREKV